MAALLDPADRLMPQVLKPELRARIVQAALAEIASGGYVETTMAAIAERAGMGTAGLYRYYPSKEALFDAAVPESIARAFEALLARRVRALGAALGAADETGEEMLAFWEAHRLAVVILLDRAEGTPYAHFAVEFVDALVGLTTTELENQGRCLDAPARFVLRGIFVNTRTMLARILEAHEDPQNMRAAIRTFWAYQIAGLNGFRDTLPSIR
jgi:AcrR family transcriptional regulator